ncbi:dienelactone hydrolase family protein [candidate division KSB1 bacterium]|nr:dienelactone hydrolase family protein [candidate division KSB1 bacterium]
MPILTGKMQIDHTVYYALSAPATETPAPLLFVLHGFGQVAAEFIKVFEPLVQRGIVVAAPQAPHQFYKSLVERSVGFSWLTRYEREQSIQDFAAYMEKFFAHVQREHRIDTNHVFVLGFSQGVSMAYRMWAHSRVPLAGLIACGGDLPPDIAESLRRLPARRVLLVHGRRDQIVPMHKAHEAQAQLSAAGLPVELFEFEGGHLIPPEAMLQIANLIAST